MVNNSLKDPHGQHSHGIPLAGANVSSLRLGVFSPKLRPVRSSGLSLIGPSEPQHKGGQTVSSLFLYLDPRSLGHVLDILPETGGQFPEKAKRPA